MKKMILCLGISLLVSTGAYAQNFPPQYQTTDATPTYVGAGSTIQADSVCKAPAYILATDHSGGVAIWFWQASTRRVDDNPATILLGTPTVTKSAAAALWSATLIVNENTINGQGTGVIGTTIDWIFVTSGDAVCMVGPLL